MLSGPLSSRTSSILSPISLIACSHEMRFHSPPSFFIGYLRRRSPWACSRTAAPLAQCAPRLNGLSQPGSWPIQTPLLTSATTVQPTEQCVQTDLTVSTAPLTADCALACVTAPPVALIAARPPIARPDPRRNERLSTDLLEISEIRPVRAARRVSPPVFFLSMMSLLSYLWRIAPSAGLRSASGVTRFAEGVRSDVLEPRTGKVGTGMCGVLHPPVGFGVSAASASEPETATAATAAGAAVPASFRKS